MSFVRRSISLAQRLIRWIGSCCRVLSLRLLNPGLEIPYTVVVGRGVVVSVTDGGHFVIGDHVSIGSFSQIKVRGGQCSVGKFVEIGQGCVVVCQEKIEIGEHALIAEYVTIRDQDHVAPSRDRGFGAKFLTTPIKIGGQTWIGAKATVLRGSVMGDCSTLGAHGLLKGYIPNGRVAVGIPAKVIDESGK